MDDWQGACQNVMIGISSILGGLLAISEALAFIPHVRSNSILHFISDVVRGKVVIRAETLPQSSSDLEESLFHSCSSS